MDTTKIIKGVVNSGRYTVTAPIVKEDYGLYLKIEGVELPSTYEVDFSNSENSGTSVTMIGNAGSVGFLSDRSEHCLKTLTAPIVARDMSLRQGRI